MRGFLAVVGGFSLILCVLIVLMLPVLLAFLVSANWLWLYVFYLFAFLMYACLVAGSVEDRTEEKATRNGGKDDE